MKIIRFIAIITRIAFVLLSTAVIIASGAPPDLDLQLKIAHAGGLEKYPRANIIFVEKRRQIKFEEDGSYVDRTYSLIKCLTEPALAYFGTLPVLEYYKYRSEGKVLSARIIRSNGQIVKVPKELITDIENPMYRELNVKDGNMRLLEVAFKDLKVGDAVEYAVEETSLRPVTRDFELKEGKYLQEDEPVAFSRLEIDGPARKPLKHILKCAENLPVRFSSMRHGNRITYIWEALDIPAFVSEPGWNTRQHFAARLLASTIPSWRDVSRTGYRISEPSMDQNDLLRSTVADITRSLKTNEEKILAIQEFLRRNIRYQGTASISSYRSKPATQTLAERFGVCRDVAVLMCSMLAAAGIRSYPAATGYNRVFDYEIPHDIFQHMIVAVPEGKGGYRLYDPTSILYFESRLPGYAGEAPLLVCTPEGEDLAKIPHIPASENMGDIRAQSRIDAGRNLVSAVTIAGKGVYDEDLRNWRKRMKAEAFTERWREILAQFHPSASLTDLSTTDPEDLRMPFRISLSYKVSGFLDANAGESTIKIPLATDVFERVVGDIVAKASRPERRHPFIVTSAAGVQAQESIHLPEGSVVRTMPEPISVNKKSLSLTVQYARTATGIEFTKTFLVDSRRFDRENYLELRKVLEANSDSRRAQVVLAIPR